MLKLVFIVSDTSWMCHVLANLDQHFWKNFIMSRVVWMQEISSIRPSCDNAPCKQMEIKQLTLFKGWKTSFQKRIWEDNLQSFQNSACMLAFNLRKGEKYISILNY